MTRYLVFNGEYAGIEGYATFEAKEFVIMSLPKLYRVDAIRVSKDDVIAVDELNNTQIILTGKKLRQHVVTVLRVRTHAVKIKTRKSVLWVQIKDTNLFEVIKGKKGHVTAKGKYLIFHGQGVGTIVQGSQLILADELIGKTIRIGKGEYKGQHTQIVDLIPPDKVKTSNGYIENIGNTTLLGLARNIRKGAK